MHLTQVEGTCIAASCVKEKFLCLIGGACSMLAKAELVIGKQETRSAFVTYTYSDVLLCTGVLAKTNCSAVLHQKC